MRRFPILLLASLAACAGAKDGPWPSLQHRPIEGPLAVAAGGKCAGVPSCGSALAPAPVPAAPEPAPPVAIDDVSARLAVIDRDIGDAAARLAKQRTATIDASRLARSAKPDSEAWVKAQIEATALDRVGNQLGDIRTRLDAIAGTLAAASAGGTDVAAPLAATGRSIARVTALQGDYAAATAVMR